MATRRGGRRGVSSMRRSVGGRLTARRSSRRASRSTRAGSFGIGRAYSRAKKMIGA